MSDATNKIQKYLDLGFQGSLLLLAFAAPVSIAATQFGWSMAIFFWLLRLVFVRPRIKLAAFDIGVLAFLGLTILSAVCSYEPAVSIRKLVPVFLVSIVYLIAGQAHDPRFRKRALTLLIAGGVLSVLGTLYFFTVGQNLKVISMTPDSPLRSAGVIENDTLWRVDGHKIERPSDLKAIEAGHPDGGDVELTWYRQEFVFTGTMHLRAGAVAEGVGLGVTDWVRGRDTRASGFYGHYVTYAEMIQLVLSLTVGLMLFLPGGAFEKKRLLIGGIVAMFVLALFMTITRASWAGALVATGVMTLFAARRKTLLILIPLGAIICAGGLWYLSAKRNVALVDSSDGSTQWRLQVWKEGWGVLTSSPRHMLVGVGMDSIKTHGVADWHMFNNGQLPMGHLHSDYLEIAFERGIPTLIAWLAWLAIYLSMLWRGFRDKGRPWLDRGILLGAFGGTIGFLSSGLVHYNFGDSENAMVVYLIMGLALGVLRGSPAEKEVAM